MTISQHINNFVNKKNTQLSNKILKKICNILKEVPSKINVMLYKRHMSKL